MQEVKANKKESTAKVNSDLNDLDNYSKTNELCQLYEYIENHCYGYDNRLKANTLMKLFNYTDHKIFRSAIEHMRQSNDFGFICSEAGKSGGYWIPANYDEVQTTLDHIYKRSKEMLKTYSILRKKVRRFGIR